jgi:hypothetical protein
MCQREHPPDELLSKEAGKFGVSVNDVGVSVIVQDVHSFYIQNIGNQ